MRFLVVFPPFISDCVLAVRHNTLITIRYWLKFLFELFPDDKTNEIGRTKAIFSMVNLSKITVS